MKRFYVYIIVSLFITQLVFFQKQLKFLSYWDHDLTTSGVEAYGFYHQMIYYNVLPIMELDKFEVEISWIL